MRKTHSAGAQRFAPYPGICQLAESYLLLMAQSRSTWPSAVGMPMVLVLLMVLIALLVGQQMGFHRKKSGSTSG